MQEKVGSSNVLVWKGTNHCCPLCTHFVPLLPSAARAESSPSAPDPGADAWTFNYIAAAVLMRPKSRHDPLRLGPKTPVAPPSFRPQCGAAAVPELT
jgi:hypothetical protein